MATTCIVHANSISVDVIIVSALQAHSPHPTRSARSTHVPAPLSMPQTRTTHTHKRGRHRSALHFTRPDLATPKHTYIRRTHTHLLLVGPRRQPLSCSAHGGSTRGSRGTPLSQRGGELPAAAGCTALRGVCFCRFLSVFYFRWAAMGGTDQRCEVT